MSPIPVCVFNITQFQLISDFSFFQSCENRRVERERIKRKETLVKKVSQHVSIKV